MELKFDNGESRRIVCPICGHNATHVDAVQVAARREDRDFNNIVVDAVTGGVVTQSELSAPVGEVVREGRRHRIALMGQCEQGHDFAIVFTQHKGSTFLEVVSPEQS